MPKELRVMLMARRSASKESTSDMTSEVGVFLRSGSSVTNR